LYHTDHADGGPLDDLETQVAFDRICAVHRGTMMPARPKSPSCRVKYAGEL
jgi:hypothetical protein